MISKSVKSKRRCNAVFLKKVSEVTVHLIDARHGCRVYLISWPYFNPHSDMFNPGGWEYHHLECKGRERLVRSYRSVVVAMMLSHKCQQVKSNHNIDTLGS